MGGLGNQMFQYALGRSLSMKKDVPFKLDISWFPMQSKRKFELSHFNISADAATQEEIFRVCYYSKNRYIRKIHSIYQKFLPYYRKRRIKEIERIDATFDKTIFLVPDNVYLEGYWQSPKYFEDIQEILFSDFRIIDPLDDYNTRILEQIESDRDSSVSLHVRRGDYVDEDTALLECSADYYMQSVNYIKCRISRPHFYIFSDDLHWVKNNLFLDQKVTFVEQNPKENAHLDLFLMSRCKHHINANSSFSWWGAWLGHNKDNLVIVPQRWFKERYPGRFTSDRAPENWVRMDA
jgi:hypothetical protein